MSSTSFDFDAYKAACMARSTEAWLAFYADDVEWIEYRQERLVLVSRARGRKEISTIFTEAGRWPDLLILEELEVDRVRFRVSSGSSGGPPMVDLVMLTVVGERIQRQVSVMAA